MESPPLARCVVPNSSNKRVFPGGSSMEEDVVEIPPPINRTSNPRKRKEVVSHDIIDVDMEGEYNDSRFSGQSFVSIGKGKETMVDHSTNAVPVTGFQTSKKICSSGPQNVINLDDSDEMYVDNVTSRSGTKSGDRTKKLEQSVLHLGPSSGEKKPAVTNGTFGQPKKSGDRRMSKRKNSGFPNVNTSFGYTPVEPSFPNVPVNSLEANWMNFPQNTMNHSTLVPPGFVADIVSGGFVPPVGSVPFYTNPFMSQNYTTAVDNAPVPMQSTSSGAQSTYDDKIIERFRAFKRFDTVQDYSDHHYSRNSSKKVTAAPKGWVKRIQDEWRILEKDLPDTIFVRVYESRMDLLRAVIIGAAGTPYHDGLFFFDVYFPSNYPNVPPHVYYHSGGLRINPNLYNCGKVCLSLLNTWSGQGKEKWVPRESTMLQVLVSIQGLILNAKPYFNEPGWAGSAGTTAGEKSSLQYSENTYISNLRTMVYSMRKPPKHFEDFVVGYFIEHAQDILVACKTYIEGAQVGSLVSGGVQDVDEGDKSCSDNFKNSVAGFINTLIESFTKIGAKGCDKFLYLAKSVAAPVRPTESVYAPHMSAVGSVPGIMNYYYPG